MQIKDIKEAIRNKYAWPGGYQLLLLTNDGEYICTDCGRSEFRNIVDSTNNNIDDGWNIQAIDVYWEGDNVYCAHCNKTIESEYGPIENE